MSFEKLDRLVERHPPEVAEDALQRGRSRFIEAAAPRASFGFRLRWLLWLVPAAAATAGLLLALRHSQQPPASVAGAAPAMPISSVRLEVPEVGPSSIELAPGARALVSRGTVAYSKTPEPGQHRIELQSGQVRLEIDPGSKSSWTVVAGSLEVRVVGTIFSVLREEATQRVRVDVERGSVRVVPAASGAREVLLQAGQSLIAEAGRLELLDAPAVTPEAASVAPVPAASAPSGRELFQNRYRARDYAGALSAAEQAGYETSLTIWDRKSVASLADAARLAGSPRRAEQALQALRSRFPGTAESADAAFLLGRLYVDALGTPAQAMGWFERYLAERPRGAYSQEALGRLMIAARSAGDSAKARSVASKYLEQYPHGPYARAATALVP